MIQRYIWYTQFFIYNILGIDIMEFLGYDVAYKLDKTPYKNVG
jgi:hypothetical protein